ncbi:MAG: histidine--tRNA ligase [Gemmatimonadetes bacterium]|nr:MAG: histidine--tRNA ligase [Gemmatimonadota bacterium]
MSKAAFQRLPGFRDFVPEDLALRSHIFDAWRRVSRRYGFREYDGPPLEPLELYVEKSGEEIVGQLYAFTDRGGREVALRPEMTPSLARILGERSRGLAKPIRWFSIPQLFRYERQQKGRLREHFQWNVDIVGEDDVAADAEVLAVAIDGLRALGLTAADVRARVSDRRLLSAVLGALGVPAEGLPATYAVVDKLEREPRERSLERLQNEAGLDAGRAREVLALFETPGLEGVRERFGERDEVGAELARLDTYQGHLEAMGLGDFMTFDLTIVRGLAYYTGIVFELFDRSGEFRAICGGGRYDRLLELVGGEPLPAVGFGMGDVVLGELLRARDLLPDAAPSVDRFIVPIGPEQRALALRIGHAERERGRSVLYALREQGVGKQFKAAASAGAREVVVLGPEEVARGVAVVRDMASGEEREVSLEELT